MNRSRLDGPGLALAALVALHSCVSGAGGAPPSREPTDAQATCRLPSDCPRGMSCLAGVCGLECREDRDCTALGRSATCDVVNGQCVRDNADAGNDAPSPSDVADASAASPDVSPAAPDTALDTSPDVTSDASPDIASAVDVVETDIAGPSVGDPSPENPYAEDPAYDTVVDLGGADPARQPYGTVLGTYRGVSAHSNYTPCSPSPRCFYETGNGRSVGTFGFQYQCVEYVVRFYAQALRYPNMNGSGNAIRYWDGPNTDAARRLERYPNDGTMPPRPGDMIIFRGSRTDSVGHIAIVREVGPDYIRIIQQNWFHNSADGNHRLAMTTTGGRYHVDNLGTSGHYNVVGWRRVPGSDPCATETCSSHGTCSGGACTCATPYAGVHCEQCAAGYELYPTCSPVAPSCVGVRCGDCETCSAGRCVAAPSGTRCTDDGNACTSDTCDAGRCTHPSVPNDCGGRMCGPSPSTCFTCGSPCGPGTLCTSAGTCMSSCGPGELFCSGRCVMTTTDSNNCGRCGNVCPSGQSCTGGVCACSGGRQYCGGACVDTSTDNNHCGGCGVACLSPRRCSSGSCTLTCAPDETACSSSTCANLSNDMSNCGACARACASGQTCSSGTCVCPGGGALCGGSCVDTSSNGSHCGGCYRSCGAGQTCSGGACACSSGVLCSGTCVNVNTDGSNCGACGRRCASGQTCLSGVCASPTIAMTSPSSGSSFSAGSTFTAAWTASNITGYVRVVIRRYGSEIATATTTGAATASQGITIPTAWAAGAGYDVCASAGSAIGTITDCRTFTVLPGTPSITMTSPSSGSSFSQGSTFTAAWTASNITGYVRVVIRRYGSEIATATTTGAATASQGITIPSAWAVGTGYDICASAGSTIGTITDCRTFSIR
jgi:CHAP domain/Stigma-specific protein, Stig1